MTLTTPRAILAGALLIAVALYMGLDRGGYMAAPGATGGAWLVDTNTGKTIWCDPASANCEPRADLSGDNPFPKYTKP